MEGFSPLPKDLNFFYEWQEKDLPNVGCSCAKRFVPEQETAWANTSDCFQRHAQQTAYKMTFLAV